MSIPRWSTLVALAVIVTLASASAATAQQRGRGFGGGGRMGGLVRGGDTLGMLRGDAVQKELKLTETQKAAAEDAVELWDDELQELMSGLQNLSQEQRREKMQDLRAPAEKKVKELLGKFEGTLDATQKERLKQLTLQRRGALRALEDPDLQTALSLNDDQKKKINAMAEEARPGRGQGGGQGAGAGGGDEEARRARFEAMQKAQKERDDKALEVLTADQKAQFEKMQGPKFEFPQFGQRRQNAPAA